MTIGVCVKNSLIILISNESMNNKTAFVARVSAGQKEEPRRERAKQRAPSRAHR
jgi:hypothetical protein